MGIFGLKNIGEGLIGGYSYWLIMEKEQLKIILSLNGECWILLKVDIIKSNLKLYLIFENVLTSMLIFHIPSLLFHTNAN